MRKFFALLIVMTIFFVFTASHRTSGNNEIQWLLKTSPSMEKNIGSNDPAKYKDMMINAEIPDWVIEKDYTVLATFKELGTPGRTAKDQGWKSLVLICDLIVLIGWPIFIACLIILAFRKLVGRILNRRR